MGHDYDKGGDPPPEMEDRRAFGWLPSAACAYEREDVHDFCPILRPAVPVLTVLDDGSQHGEALRLRGGPSRSAGPQANSCFPTIRRSPASMQRSCGVRGREAFSGSFSTSGASTGPLSVPARAVLHEEAIVILGARRFRLRNPLVPRRGASPSSATGFDATAFRRRSGRSRGGHAERGQGLELPLRSDGAPSAAWGAARTSNSTTHWSPIAMRSSAAARRHVDDRRRDDRQRCWGCRSPIDTEADCYFRCGEQLFRFELPELRNPLGRAVAGSQPYATRAITQVRYSPSRQLAVTGWSAAAPRLSRIWIGAAGPLGDAGQHLEEVVAGHRPQQEHVTRMPRVSSRPTATRLMRW